MISRKIDNIEIIFSRSRDLPYAPVFAPSLLMGIPPPCPPHSASQPRP
jgi:hypothetical protein